MATFYDTHKDIGVMPAAIPAISIIMILNIVGITGNSLVIAITVHSKNLRSTANYLLAIESFFDSIHVMAHFYFAYVLYSGKNFDTLPTCLHIMTVPLTGLNIGTSLIFFTAVDRIFAMLLPVKHQKLNKVFYLGSILAICMGYNACILYIGYLNAAEHSDTMVICLIIEGLHGTPAGIWSATAASFIFGAVFIYIIIGILIRFKNFSKCSTAKLYKSLLIICIIFAFSWIGSMTAFVCNMFNASDELSFFLSLYLGITINIACASNFFVLTRYSTDYRIAFKELFEKFRNQRIFVPIGRNSSST
ncbi:hypothetical protein FO519_003117 [Halicephalobus sp. NKZ332]|nr:hypothetical protein FO519_003117 [Halicephalobus sp. NKZ332]